MGEYDRRKRIILQIDAKQMRGGMCWKSAKWRIVLTQAGVIQYNNHGKVEK